MLLADEVSADSGERKEQIDGGAERGDMQRSEGMESERVLQARDQIAHLEKKAEEVDELAKELVRRAEKDVWMGANERGEARVEARYENGEIEVMRDGN
eukprot:751176-Hanusia_phi.AAC.2